MESKQLITNGRYRSQIENAPLLYNHCLHLGLIVRKRRFLFPILVYPSESECKQGILCDLIVFQKHN